MIEIKTTDQGVMDIILDIAREFGGEVEERTPLMRGYASVQIPAEKCSKELWQFLDNTMP